MKRLLALVCAVSVAGGCSSSGSQPSGSKVTSATSNGTRSPGNSSASSQALSGSIRVDAASSLTEAFNTIKAQFTKAHPGTSIAITYGASSDLSTQITQGAHVDVFASASVKNMDAVVTAGAASDPVDFVSNSLEIAVPPGNPGKVTGVADLAKSTVKVAVCDPAVPCGVVAAAVFSNAKITVHPKANEPDVKSTLAIVESGEVDAGLVYITDVRSAVGKVKGIKIPVDMNASTTYPIAALTNAGNPTLAKAFVDYVLSAEGKKVLTSDGFGIP